MEILQRTKAAISIWSGKPVKSWNDYVAGILLPVVAIPIGLWIVVTGPSWRDRFAALGVCLLVAVVSVSFLWDSKR
jgi:hypothetical protein